MRFILLFLVLTGFLMAQDKKPETVDNVNLKKYVGLWYEIAKIPNNFQDQCIGGTTAEYMLNEDGSIKVVNTCIDEDGEKDVAEGLAKVVDKKTNSKLEVSFVSFLGIRPFWGDYWILGLGDNYEYACVGSPNRKYGWILARDKKLPENKLQEAFQIFKDKGYNIKKFEMTEQSDVKE